MAAAIIAGIIIALVGFVPYAFMMKRSRKMMAEGSMNGLKWLLLTFVVSFAILLIALIVCSKVAHDVVLPFAFAEILTFIVVVIAYGLLNNRGAKN